MTTTIAYLVSQYPAYSHTFILREVQQLRQKGLAIQVASINSPDRPLEKLTAIEREEAELAYYVKQQGPLGALKALFKTVSQSPGACFKGFLTALCLGGWDIKRLIYHVFYWVEALLVGQWMREQQLTHLHVHFATPAASVGLLVKKIFKVGFSLTVHGPDEFYDAPGYCLPQKIQAADFVICISFYARSQLMKLSPIEQWSKFEVCRLGVDPERFRPFENADNGQKATLLCVGRLTPAKGQGILLASLAELKQQGYALKLCLVGTGPDAKSLQNHAAELKISASVEFVGAVDQEAILDYYQRADIFVLPSFAEGLPVVLMEAMAMEIPCVTTAITGIPELIKDSEHGVLVPASDTQGLTRALATLLDDPTLRQKLGQAGRKKVLSDFQLQKNTQHLFAVFGQRLGP